MFMASLQKPAVQGPENITTKSYKTIAAPPRPWSNGLQDVLDQPAPSLPFKLMLSGLLFFGLFGAWAWTSQVDDVAVARGKLIPQTEARKVQHDDSGKVIQLMIKEGDMVQKGQVIMELDKEPAQKEIDRLKTVLTASQMELLQTQGMLDRIKLPKSFHRPESIGHRQSAADHIPAARNRDRSPGSLDAV
jgi:hemolysin D